MLITGRNSPRIYEMMHGKIFVVDWIKKDMPEGPPAKIRCLPEQVKEQMIRAGFNDADIYNELQKHFLVVGEKSRLYT